MEIDFLGLSLPKYDMEQQSSEDALSGTANEGGVETSLSLSTCSFLDCEREIPSFCEKNKTWEFPCDKIIPSCSGNSTTTMCSLAHGDNENFPKIEQPSPVVVPRPVFHPLSTTSGFRFDLNKKSRDLSRSMSELQAEPTTLTNMLYPACANVYKYASPQKPDNAMMYITGDASNRARTCTTGHTPTVAMARRATLARFLEKRVHRMNQARTPHLIRKSMNAFEAHDTVITRSNKNKNNSILR